MAEIIMYLALMRAKCRLNNETLPVRLDLIQNNHILKSSMSDVNKIQIAVLEIYGY